MSNHQTNVPTNVNIDEAVTLYYARTEIETKDIQTIFGCSASKANHLKKMAREAQDADNIPYYNARAVNVESAYRTWGLDVKRMERAQRHPKLRMGEATE